MCEGLKTANQTVWDSVYKRYQAKKITEDNLEKNAILTSLGCSRDEMILFNFLNKTINDENEHQFLSKVIQSVYGINEIGLNVSLKFISHNVAHILKM